MTKACRTIFNLSLGKSLLVCLILWSQKDAPLEDLEIWVDIVKLESNQEPRLPSSDTGLMSVAPTRTGLITLFCFVFQLFSLMDKSQDGKATVVELNSLPGEVSLSLLKHFSLFPDGC